METACLPSLEDSRSILQNLQAEDACAGKVAKCAPKEDGSQDVSPSCNKLVVTIFEPLASCPMQDSWLYGYGFSYVYRRDEALARPFPHCHLGEDGLRGKPQ